MYRQALFQPRQRLFPKLTDKITHQRPLTALLSNPPSLSAETPRNYSAEPSRRFSSDDDHRKRENPIPHYLVPQAYRRRDPEADSSGDYKRDAKAHHRRTNAREGKTSRSHSRNQSVMRRRRKKNHHLNSARLMRRQSKSKADDEHVLTLEEVTILEEELSRKLNEYTKRIEESFGMMASKMGEQEEREREMPFGTETGVDPIPSLADLYATEESYASIAQDFKALIVGLCQVAEEICGNKRMENSQRAAEGGGGGNKEGKEDRMILKEYEGAISKAENYLEAFETFCRNRAQVVNSSKERLMQNELESNKVLEEVGSFFRGVFTNPLSRTNDFDESWKRREASQPTGSDVTELGEITASNFDDLLLSHRNGELAPGISLYEHVLSTNHSAYCFGKQAKLESTERSNRLLNRWISLYCLHAKSAGSADASSSSSSSSKIDSSSCSQYDATYPEQRLFHLVMRQNADLWTKEGSQRVEEWLRRMESLQQADHTHCFPDLHAYNLVLLSYCNLCKSSGSTKPQAGGSKGDRGRFHSKYFDESTRRYILNGVETIMAELIESKEIDINVISLDLALNAFAKAGRNEVDLCKRTDRLLCRVLGKERFAKLIDDAPISDADAMPEDLKNILQDSLPSNVEPDLDTYHWLVDIYSSSGNLFYIQRAMKLLEKMVQLRKEIDSNNENDGEVHAPSTGTFNNVLRALQCKVDELGRLSNMNDEDLELLSEQTRRELKEFSPVDIATSLTPLLDSMIQFETSLPTRVTFLFILQVWIRTQSPEAGDQAEELLSRMEVLNTYHQVKPFSNAYKLVLQCWLTSAKAGRPGALERAHRILEIMEAQSGHGTTGSLFSGDAKEADATFNHSDIFDNSISDSNKLYPLMFKICAVTHGKVDTARALDIAFEIFDKMVKSGMKPLGRTFELMYVTAQNFIECNPDLPENEKQQILNRVIDAARQHNVSRGELIGRWQQAQIRAGLDEAGDSSSVDKHSGELVREASS